MVECIVRDTHRILPVAAYLRGEYGIKGHFVGVPAMLGRNGVERVYEIPVGPERREQLQRSVALIEETVAKLEIDI